MLIYNNIKHLREIKGISRTRLANLLNITYHALAKYENNQRQPDYITLIKIADYFDVSLDYLLNRTDNNRGCLDLEENDNDTLPPEAQQVLEEFRAYVYYKYKKTNN